MGAIGVLRVSQLASSSSRSAGIQAQVFASFCCQHRRPLLDTRAFQSGTIRAPMSKPSAHSAYWRANLIVVSILLGIWFLFSCCLSIFFVEELNRIEVGGFLLGFWIAQQGSIFVFIALVLVYALVMRRLDRKHDVQEDRP